MGSRFPNEFDLRSVKTESTTLTNWSEVEKEAAKAGSTGWAARRARYEAVKMRKQAAKVVNMKLLKRLQDIGVEPASYMPGSAQFIIAADRQRRREARLRRHEQLPERGSELVSYKEDPLFTASSKYYDTLAIHEQPNLHFARTSPRERSAGDVDVRDVRVHLAVPAINPQGRDSDLHSPQWRGNVDATQTNYTNSKLPEKKQQHSEIYALKSQNTILGGHDITNPNGIAKTFDYSEEGFNSRVKRFRRNTVRAAFEHSCEFCRNQRVLHGGRTADQILTAAPPVATVQQSRILNVGPSELPKFKGIEQIPKDIDLISPGGRHSWTPATPSSQQRTTSPEETTKEDLRRVVGHMAKFIDRRYARGMNYEHGDS
jgi:hypothetical protein